MNAHIYCISWLEKRYAARSQRTTGCVDNINKQRQDLPPPPKIIAWEIMRVDKLYDLGAPAPTDVFLSVLLENVSRAVDVFQPTGAGEDQHHVRCPAQPSDILFWSSYVPKITIIFSVIIFLFVNRNWRILHTLLHKLSGVVISMAALVLLSATVDFCWLEPLNFIG